MNASDYIWKTIGTLVVAATAAVPVYVSYDLWGRGSAPEKDVELTRFGIINPLRDLSFITGGGTSLSLRFNDQPADNLVIASTQLKNVGKSPIVPADYVGPLTVSVKPPWKIVAVANSSLWTSGVQLKWKRVDDLHFEAEPALLNPGDVVWTYVYATTIDGLSSGPDVPKPEVEWAARIVNLRAFRETAKEDYTGRFWGVIVELSGWGVPFTLASATLFLAIYLRLLVSIRLLRNWRMKSIGIVLWCSLLSFSVAECIATYLFGTSMTRVAGVSHWLNAPPILLHVAFIAYLWCRLKRRLGEETIRK